MSDTRFTIYDLRFTMGCTFRCFKQVLYCAILCSIFSCANQVAPTGGDKDVEPPKILKAIPENYSTNIKTHDIVITFDEYVQLKDISTQLIVSPPLKYP